MRDDDRRQLEEAVRLLESPSWASRLTSLVGMPVEWAVARLPARANDAISAVTVSAMRKALGAAVATMGAGPRSSPSKGWHRGAVALSGGLGGMFGWAGLTVELPVSTVIMLRAIADIARSEGEDVRSVETQLQCLQVFALGGPSPEDDASETAYYAVRLGLARAVAEAGEYIARRGLVEEGAPVIVRLLARIAARFDVVVTEKVAAQAVPIVGAAAGSAINLLFINSFQSLARGHFVVRRLEKAYGSEVVRREYEAISRALPEGARHTV